MKSVDGKTMVKSIELTNKNEIIDDITAHILRYYKPILGYYRSISDEIKLNIRANIYKNEDGKSVDVQFVSDDNKVLYMIISTNKEVVNDPEILINSEKENWEKYGNNFDEMFDETYSYAFIETIGTRFITIEHSYGYPNSTEEVFIDLYRGVDEENRISIWSDDKISLNCADHDVTVYSSSPRNVYFVPVVKEEDNK